MSADVPAETWLLTLPCTRAEAEAIAAAPLAFAAVLMTTEVDEAAEAWRLDAYFEGEPDAVTLATVRELAASGGWSTAVAAPISPQDWVTLSQAGLEPVRAGRFVVHTDAHPADPPPGGRSFRIEAGQAFGTGHHETTAGCLAMLDALASEGARFDAVVDLGTGTGLLAFAALHLWPCARVVASDVDPIAIEVARENAVMNGVLLSKAAGEVALIVADGTAHPALADARFDLVIANILAAPLIDMAVDVARIGAPGATIVLAGLLSRQADEVAAAYAAWGCALIDQVPHGDWSVLRLTRT